jgi:NADPH:quinone reductase-like Zn-dependent oxidoreductase
VNPVDCDYIEAGISRGTLGHDGAGTVVSLGAGCSLKVGDEVYGTMTGAYATYAVGTCSALSKKPKSLTFAEAGTIPIVGGTSLQCLQAAGLPSKKTNLTVVVTAGQGGTGFMGVQLAKALGATKVITAATGDGIAFVRSLGADVVVDYHKRELFSALPDDSVDIVYDNLGLKGTADKAMHSIKTGGFFLVLTGGDGGDISRHPKAGVHQKKFGIATASKKEFDQLAGFFDSGKLKPHIFGSYGLGETAKALAALRGHGVLGKVSIVPGKPANSSFIV